MKSVGVSSAILIITSPFRGLGGPGCNEFAPKSPKGDLQRVLH